MAETKTQHIWMPDQRSLCDRRPLPPGLNVVELNDEEFEEYVEEHLHAPVCGPCMLIIGRLRRQGVALYERAATQVWPKKPTQAWQLLADTRWGLELDIPEFLKRDDLDTSIRFNAIADAVDIGSVRDLVDEREKHVERVRADRARWLKDRPESKTVSGQDD